jgi:hypothetical protein
MGSLPSPPRGRQRRKTCVVQARLGCTCTGQCRQLTASDAGIVSPTSGEDSAKGALLPLDNRGPQKGSALSVREATFTTWNDTFLVLG